MDRDGLSLDYGWRDEAAEFRRTGALQGPEQLVRVDASFPFELMPAGPPTEEQVEWDAYTRRRVANHRPMCGTCGRFLKKATVAAHRLSYWAPEYEHTGTCVVHGTVDVVWPEP